MKKVIISLFLSYYFFGFNINAANLEFSAGYDKAFITDGDHDGRGPKLQISGTFDNGLFVFGKYADLNATNLNPVLSPPSTGFPGYYYTRNMTIAVFGAGYNIFIKKLFRIGAYAGLARQHQTLVEYSGTKVTEEGSQVTNNRYVDENDTGTSIGIQFGLQLTHSWHMLIEANRYDFDRGGEVRAYGIGLGTRW